MGALKACPPRVLIVSRRLVRKQKYVDFVGEFHLNLVMEYGAVPIIVPRVKGIVDNLQAFEPFHGLLLVEGEDVAPPSYNADYSALTEEERANVNKKFSGDVAVDPVKDELEMELVRVCLARGLPILSICRGSQILNVTCGGDLYLDVETQLGNKVVHYDSNNYDAHRHPIDIVSGTPLHKWFKAKEFPVSSYHHCGVKTLAPRFKPMATAPDGLVEAYYDPNYYDVRNGRYIVGLQFHPERMQDLDAHLDDREPIFDHPCLKLPYKDFVRAVKVNAELSSLRSANVKSLVQQMTHIPAHIKKPQNWRAHVSLHGGTMALSLLQEGLDPIAEMEKQFLVPEEDISIHDGKVIVDLTESVDIEENENTNANQSDGGELIKAAAVAG